MGRTMSENDPKTPENLPEPVAKTEAVQTGWLAAINPTNAMRVIHGIGRIAGTASRLSNSLSQTVRENKAKDTISAAIAQRIATGIAAESPQFERAFAREADRLLREQENLDQVADIAMETLGQKAEKDFEPGDLDEDWLHQFEDAAKGYSSERMKHTFGRLLAGEILRPGSFSPATLKAVATMSSTDAQLIVTFLSLAYKPALPNQPVSPQLLTAGTFPGSNGLLEFGLSYGNLSLLQQCGFLSHDLSTSRTVQAVLFTLVPALIGSQFCQFIDSVSGEPSRSLQVEGLILTKVGEEIAKIVEVGKPPDNYLTKLSEHMEGTHQLKLLRL